MEELYAALQQAYCDYRQELEEAGRKYKPTDGLLGFGHSIKDDACHERFDQRLAQIVSQMSALPPAAEDAERAVRLLLFREEKAAWPLPAQLMLRAAERHSLPLIGFLTPEAAAALQRDYTARYRRWDRLPAQKQVLKALTLRAKG